MSWTRSAPMPGVGRARSWCLCGLAGVVAGRLTRSAVATRTSLDSEDDLTPRTGPRRRASYAPN